MSNNKPLFRKKCFLFCLFVLFLTQRCRLAVILMKFLCKKPTVVYLKNSITIYWNTALNLYYLDLLSTRQKSYCKAYCFVSLARLQDDEWCFHYCPVLTCCKGLLKIKIKLSEGHCLPIVKQFTRGTSLAMRGTRPHFELVPVQLQEYENRLVFVDIKTIHVRQSLKYA